MNKYICIQRKNTGICNNKQKMQAMYKTENTDIYNNKQKYMCKTDSNK